MDLRKIENSIDVDAMQNSRVAMIGGAVNLSYCLARCGLGGISLVDFDYVSATNPARQDFNSTDIARRKVEVMAENLLRINSEIEVESYVKDYCSGSSEEYGRLFGDMDLLIHATDFFPAQARGNVEAVRLQKPAMWIGLYQGGRAGEIIYYVPGLTPACYRCICSTRYQAFSKGGASVSSAGGTIFDLHLVDAVAGHIAVGILTRGADNRYGRLVDMLGNRNLLQVKNDPDYRLGDKDIFRQYLGNDPSNFSFTTICLAMERDTNCPDCSYLHRQDTHNGNNLPDYEADSAQQNLA
jgi:hypothetical protein